MRHPPRNAKPSSISAVTSTGFVVDSVSVSGPNMSRNHGTATFGSWRVVVHFYRDKHLSLSGRH